MTLHADTPLVIALGNRLCGDDAFGPQVLELLNQRLQNQAELVLNPGDILSLVNTWRERRQVYLVDACRDSARRPGEVVVIEDALCDSGKNLQTLSRSCSSHALNIIDAIELSHTLQCAPQNLCIFAAVGEHFATGEKIGAAVLAAVARVADQLFARILKNNSLDLCTNCH